MLCQKHQQAINIWKPFTYWFHYLKVHTLLDNSTVALKNKFTIRPKESPQ